MNGHPQYSRFPQQHAHPQDHHSNAYTGYTAHSFHPAQYTYPASITALPPQQHPPLSQYFQALPQGAPAPAPQKQQRQNPTPQPPASSGAARRDASPPNDPGAPPAERNSPPPGFEEELMNALQNHMNDGNPSSAPRANNDDDDDDDEDDGDHDMVDNSEPLYQLPPPPEMEYPSEAELEKAIHAWSLAHGYELVRRASKKNAQGEQYKRYWHCSKHGKKNPNKTPEKDRVRKNRKSSKLGCPMSLAAVSVDAHDITGPWQIRLRKTYHNHPAVEAGELAGHRRRARFGAVEQAVDGLLAIETSTKDVLKFLQRAHPEGLFKRTDVANMKLRFRKYGTCVSQPEGTQLEVIPQTTPAASQRGFASACNKCRGRKAKCDSQRPACGRCVTDGVTCVYDHLPPRRPPQPQQLPPPQQRVTPAGPARPQQPQNQAMMGASDDNAMQDDTPLPDFHMPSNTGHANAVSSLTPQAQQAQQAFAAMAAFRQENRKPARLDLNSSTVEVLASSTCGKGDSYRSAIPQQFSIGGDWKKYKEAFESAAVKENCVDVLVGTKTEPDRPKPVDEEAGVDVEVHNEYIKQLAIFKRRNEMLMQGFRETLAPALWSRMKLLRNAFEVWKALDGMCWPRGSDQAYQRFNEILYVTLANCGGNLDHYIQTLELKWSEFNQMANTHESRRTNFQLNMSSAEVLKRKIAGNGTFPEEMLCFLFLRNLGPQHQNLAANMCKKNNIGGFGSGDRCGFKDLWKQVKRSMEK